MARLIDADVLFKAYENNGWYNNADRDEIAEKILLEMPTEDAVEVVRCKDCKYAHMTYSGECKSCDMWKDDDDFTMTLYLDGDFYCAFAERREDGKIG